jgi:hypothetical protein
MRSALLLGAAAVAAADYAVRLTPFGDNSIRVQVAAPGNAIADPPLSALLDVPPATRTVVLGDGATSLTNGNLAVTVDPATGLATATRVSDGAVLLRQTALNFTRPNVNGTRLGSVSATVTFAGTPGEKVYGLGEHRTGTVQQLPYHKRFADSQDYDQSHGGDVSIPWYASSRGYGFVWNSPAYGYVDLSEAALTWFANATQGADYWVTTTPVSFDAASGVSPYVPLLAQYVDAVGHAPKMPFYATGFIQCKDRYRNQSQLLDVARGYVARQLPISVIVIDWMHWQNQGDWSFNPTCWPDPAGMVAELASVRGEGRRWARQSHITVAVWLPSSGARSVFDWAASLSPSLCPAQSPLSSTRLDDPAALPFLRFLPLQRLNPQLGIEPMVTFWPFQTTGSKHWQEFSSSGYLVNTLNGTQKDYDGGQVRKTEGRQKDHHDLTGARGCVVQGV